MTTETIIFFVIVIFLTHIVQTITGFAASMLSMPFLTMIISLSDAKVLLTTLGLVWSLWIIFTDHKYIDWKFLWFVVIVMLAGIVVGSLIIDYISIHWLMVLMGITIIASAIRGFLKHHSEVKSNVIVDTIFGFAAGVMQALVVMGGPLLVVLTSSHFRDRRYYRATLAALWIVVNIILLFVFKFQGILSSQSIWLTIIGVPSLIAAIFVGNKINNRINNDQFNIFVNALLVISGILILLQA